MTLPYDYARCAGTAHETCQWCRRREPGREQWQTYIAPAIDMMGGQCSNFIEPPKVYATNNTVPNAEVRGATPIGGASLSTAGLAGTGDDG